jgi:hypothetical protein
MVLRLNGCLRATTVHNPDLVDARQETDTAALPEADARAIGRAAAPAAFQAGPRQATAVVSGAHLDADPDRDHHEQP